jgi:HlyD family secretion protein
MSDMAMRRGDVPAIRQTSGVPALWQPPGEVLILDAPRPRTRIPVLLGWAVVLIFVLGLGSWAAFTPLAEAAIAQGLLKVEGTRRTIQHFEGGIVREILVRDGDQVRQGQVLVRLDQPQAGQQTETLRSQRWALLAQDARLMAELAGSREIAFPRELSTLEAARAQDAVAGQRSLFEARRTALESQLTVLGARIEQFEAQIRSSEAQRESQSRQLVLLQAEEANTHAKRVVELNPDDTFSYTALSVIYQRCGRIPEAEEAKARAYYKEHGLE